MEQYSFTVQISGGPADHPQYEDVIFEAGCNDALIAVVDGRMLLDFDRYAASYDSAVSSATHALQSIGATIVRVSPITD